MARILVADDNSNIQKMVGLALKDEGIDVVAVGNGEAAVRKLSDVRPDLVLADVFMPVRNGYEVCEYVKNHAETANIPVILLVGAFDPLDEQEAQRVRADGVLKKPFVPPDPLISMVKSALARAGVSLTAPPPPDKSPVEAASLISSVPLPPKEPAPVATVQAQNALPIEEELPVRPVPVKFESRNKPVAFSSLLETASATKEDEDAPEIQQGRSPERDWGASTQVEEEEEEAASGTTWRRDGGDEALEDEAVRGVSDWRETLTENEEHAAKHHEPWSPVQGTKSHSGMEEVLVEENRIASEVLSTAEIAVAEPAVSEIALAATEQNELGAVTDPVHFETVETQEAHSDEAQPVSVAVTDVAEESSSLDPALVASETKPDGGETQASPEKWFSIPANPWDSQVQKVDELASTWEANYAPVTAPAEPYVPEPAVTAVADAPAEETFAAETGSSIISESTPHFVMETPQENIAAEPAATDNTQPEAIQGSAQEAPSTPSTEAAPDIDAMVAKVLERMSPEAIQAVTRELLRPVVESILKENLKK